MTVDVRLQLMAATLAALEAEKQLDTAGDQLYKALVANGEQAKADSLYQVLAGLRRNLSAAYESAMEAAESATEEQAAAVAAAPPPTEEVTDG